MMNRHENMHTGTVVGVFQNQADARDALRDLKDAGFMEDQLGIAGRGDEDVRRAGDATDDESYAGEGAVAGLATGAGLGALWGAGILAGMLPVIGPAIAGGTLGIILSSAAAGAAAAGIAGALIGMGMSKEDAEYYEGELHSGRTLVTVNAGTRFDEAIAIIRRHNGYDRSTAATTTHRTIDVPVSNVDQPVIYDRDVTNR